MKRIKDLEEIVIPFTITFPVTIEGSVNSDTFLFKRDVEYQLTYPQYEALRHSSFVKYLD